MSPFFIESIFSMEYLSKSQIKKANQDIQTPIHAVVHMINVKQKKKSSTLSQGGRGLIHIHSNSHSPVKCNREFAGGPTVGGGV